MNRVHSMVLAGVLAVVGGLGLGASSVQAQAPGGAAPAPRYYYGPGYYGYGYYYYPTAPSVPTYRGGFYSNPSYSSTPGSSRPSGRTGVPHDPTGRDVPLYKPWLRPLQ